MKLVKQRTDFDCSLAAMAMVLGKDYDEVWKPEDTLAVSGGEDGKGYFGVGDYAPWLMRLNLIKHVDWVERYTATSNQKLVKDMIKWRRALLSVNSLNNEAGLHAVYWDGDKLYDPSNKNCYAYLSTVTINSLILFKQ
jgi:hypothetical protein